MKKILDKINKEYKAHKIKEKKEFERDKNKIKIRFYFWEWNNSFYGWRQMGNAQGYDNLEELKRDNSFYILGTKDYPSSKNWKILKAYVIEQKQFNQGLVNLIIKTIKLSSEISLL